MVSTAPTVRAVNPTSMPNTRTGGARGCDLVQGRRARWMPNWWRRSQARAFYFTFSRASSDQSGGTRRYMSQVITVMMKLTANTTAQAD